MNKTEHMKAILACPMKDNDANADTVGNYLIALARGVWIEGEGFGGKRPFGNSSWEYEVYQALFENELMEGTIDEWEELDLTREEQLRVDKLITDALNHSELVIVS